MTKLTESFIDILSSELNQYLQQIDHHSIKKAADLIETGEKKQNRVHITGIGKPSYVAGYGASLLSSTGTSAYFLDGTEAVHGSSGQVKSGDIVIAVSNSGETHELISTVKTLINNGAIIIACTGKEDSWLAAHASVHLAAGVKREGDSLNKPPRASILAETIILQALSVELQERKKLTKEDYLRWHPGGSLGQGIRNEKKGKNNE